MGNEYILELKELSVSYTPGRPVVKKVSVSIRSNAVTAIIGPPDSGKTTLLRSINRLHELYPSIKTDGEIRLKGVNIQSLNPIEVRRRIGMVFPNPNVFPNMDIYTNVLSGYMLNRIPLSKEEKNRIVEENLKETALWEDVKNSLYKKPHILSTQQQQLLCIARAIALKPEIVLMDEPAFSLDSWSNNRIEELILRLKEKHTIVIASNNLSQAARISDYTMYLKEGELIEYEATSKLFWNPADKRTEAFITSQTE
ncbi:MAG: ATP-binding cassette domain-containing protein [Candidatus Symbiothrix sp.]|jgi:phosphate transport system ATP-binding protein|nr:ATP-binding cassette domain-containing protein [Candidatus Symbiothrix sp.]